MTHSPSRPKNSAVSIALGVKTDPIHYRYSYEWLFDLLAEEGIRHVQFGTFFELYQLDDGFFRNVREQAESRGIKISSVFTSHRELGGFFIDDSSFERVARRSYERLIEVGALLGADCVGCNPGAVLRDRMNTKTDGVRRYIDHMKELMVFARDVGVGCLCIEPMSCLAEPPTLPDEIDAMAGELMDYHRANSNTAPVGYCADISHGYADESGTVVHSHVDLFRATIPYLREFHIRNTDARFDSTFGFGEAERKAGIVESATFRDLLRAEAASLPVDHVIGYLEIGGPKLGRDYSDPQLDAMLRDSLRHLRTIFGPDPIEDAHESSRTDRPATLGSAGSRPT